MLVVGWWCAAINLGDEEIGGGGWGVGSIKGVHMNIGTGLWLRWLVGGTVRVMVCDVPGHRGGKRTRSMRR